MLPPKGALPYKRKKYNMKRKTKLIILCLLVVALSLIAAGCSQTPYELNDEQGYTVSVKFDANGGSFTTNAPVIVDSYDLSQIPVNDGGKASIPLIAPDNESRGKDAFSATNGGYFLVGWYAQRQENTDENGNVTYTYSQPWDFENDRLELDPNAGYSSQEPVLTLYAAWAPLYEIEFYALESGELLGTYSFDPREGTEIQVPHWDEETGAVAMYKFPKREGYTFENAYYDAQGTQPVTDAILTHPATLSTETAAVENGTMKLYVQYRTGQWYRISTAKQFAGNFSLNGCYEILADLDFTDVIWPTGMMYGSFTGIVNGNGHTISNVSIEQTNNSKVYAGLFGQIAEEAVLQDVVFDNITFTVKNGTRVAGTAYGLLAGSVADGATLSNVQITQSTLQIDSGCYFGTTDYSIGLICGMGTTQIDNSGITCVAVGNDPEKVSITVTDNTVNVEFVTQ